MQRKPLANNIVRVWGFKDGKRTHVDIEAEMVRVPKECKHLYKGKKYVKWCAYPEHFIKPLLEAKMIDCATSIDIYSGTCDRRFKNKLI